MLTEGASLTEHMLLYPTASKIADGSNDAVLTGFRATAVSGSPTGVTLVRGPAATATFDSVEPGTAIGITYSGYSIAGADVARYALAVPCCNAPTRTTGTITPAPVVTPPPVVIPPVVTPPPVVAPPPVMTPPPVVTPPVVTPPAVVSPVEVPPVVTPPLVVPPVIVTPVVVTPVVTPVVAPPVVAPAVAVIPVIVPVAAPAIVLVPVLTGSAIASSNALVSRGAEQETLVGLAQTANLSVIGNGVLMPGDQLGEVRLAQLDRPVVAPIASAPIVQPRMPVYPRKQDRN